MSDMAKVRQLLETAKHVSDQPEVIDLIDQAIALSYRKYVKAKAPATSRALTQTDVDAILRVYKNNPLKPIQAIANEFRCNPGRVSEVITGKHKLQNGG